jgi:hypothetical protein
MRVNVKRFWSRRLGKPIALGTAITISLGAIAVWSTKYFHQPTQAVDSWYTFYESGVYSLDWPELEKTNVFRVRPEKIEQAIARLESLSVISLTPSEFAEWTGRDLPVVKGKAPYLVRALRERNINGVFIISRHGSILRVAYSSVGAANPICREPLVVLLESKPERVLISVGGAI